MDGADAGAGQQAQRVTRGRAGAPGRQRLADPPSGLTRPADVRKHPARGVGRSTTADAKAVYLSYDIDVIDAGFVPGTGWPEPGGLLPREALNLIRMISAPGLAGLEVVECAPPYDWAEQTALLSSRVILDSLAALVREGHLGRKPALNDRHAWGPRVAS
ncbi:arginase family protein [Streptomyces sp. NPDC088789]|uniref:arginase family protein n=1 Tax=Streptomyces sp. NPDC088789 TaxID=3365899 RepID=UPI0037F7D1EB